MVGQLGRMWPHSCRSDESGRMLAGAVDAVLLESSVPLKGRRRRPDVAKVTCRLRLHGRSVATRANVASARGSARGSMVQPHLQKGDRRQVCPTPWGQGPMARFNEASPGAHLSVLTGFYECPLPAMANTWEMLIAAGPSRSGSGAAGHITK